MKLQNRRWQKKFDSVFQRTITLYIVLQTFVFVAFSQNRVAVGQSVEFSEEKITIKNGDEILEGTILVPDQRNKKPAIILLSGSGPGGLEFNREVAEGFARAGFLALRYDKRTNDYSASPVGYRSYNLLADDVLAVVNELKKRSDVDTTAIGLWGISEGAWVAPLAASQTDNISFVILVGAIGVAPASQVAWSVQEALTYNGVTHKSIRRAIAVQATRFMVASGEMEYFTYNPVPALEQVQQPILAIWGTKDKIAPPVESASILQKVLKQSGNSSYNIRFFNQADHNIYQSADGFKRIGGLAPGYIATMTQWISNVISNEVPGPLMDTFSTQNHPIPQVIKTNFFDNWYIHLTFAIGLLIAFGGFILISIWRYLKNQRKTLNLAKWPTYIVLVLGSITWLGTYWYVFSMYLTMTGPRILDEPILFGRPITWILLQAASLAVFIATIFIVIVWWKNSRSITKSEQFQLSSLLFGAFIFVPWAFYWNLLIL